MKRQSILRSALCLLMALVYNVTWAQAVIFPQEQQPGTAKVKVVGDDYTIGNDLFTAKFVKADGKLTFGGCEELGLMAGSEIFKVVLGDGTEIPASAFTLEGDVVTEALTGQSNAVKAARRYNGQQIKAVFTHTSGLEIEWRAVLRDGSHYLRTEMDILNNGTEGISMNSIYPMLYTVQNVDGEKAPAVVGNTRGAVIASDKIFAGVETPTAYNMAGEATDLEKFAFKAWTGASSFAWTPEAEETPAGIKALPQYGANTIVGSRGYVIFREAGEQTITLQYTGQNSDGNKKLHVLGVDIVSLDGTVIGDYHYGTTGGLHSDNEYTINVPQVGAYMVRYFISTHEESIASVGKVIYSGKVSLPTLVYDLASTETPYYTSSNDQNNDETEATAAVHLARSAATRASGTPTYKLTSEKINSATLNAMTETAYIAIKNLATGNNGYFKGNGSIASPSSDDVIFILEPKSDASGKFYLKKLNGQYVQNSSPKDFGTIDNAAVFTTTNPTQSAGTNAGALYFNGDADSGSYIDGNDDSNLVRFVKDSTTTWINVQPMSNGTPTYNDGKGGYTIHYAYKVEPTSTFVFNPGSATFGNWVNASWTAAQNVPQEILDMGYTKEQVTSMEQTITVEEAGSLDVTFTWKGGNHRLDLVGVDLVDSEGNVVSCDYNRQDINSSAPAKYSVVAPVGTYTLRYFVETKTETVNSNGSISIVHTSLTQLNAESTTAQYKWDTRNNNWSAFTDWTGTLPEGVTNPGTAKYIDHYYTMGVGFVTVEFDYSESIGASHKINTLGVQLLDLKGNVVSSDFHTGASGTNTKATYKVVVPKEGVYILRSIVCRTNGDYNTAGDTNISFEAITTRSISSDATTAAAWLDTDSRDVDANDIPAEIKALKNENGVAITQVKMSKSEYFDIKAGRLKGLYSWKSGSGTQRVNIVGVELVDLYGVVVAADYHWGWAGSAFHKNTYAMNVPQDGVYYFRYYAETNTNVLNSDIDITYSMLKNLGTIDEDNALTDAWTPEIWKTIAAEDVPNRVNEVGCTDANARIVEQQITVKSAGALSIVFNYERSAGNRLDIAGVDLIDAYGQIVSDDYHAGYAGSQHENNTYKFNVRVPGTYTLRYFANAAGAINSYGNIKLSLAVDYTLHLVAAKTTPLTGKWSRVTTLKAGEEWNIGAVVGVIAPGQARRSFLCYSERERAVPWRAVPAYISWYEININRNNAAPGHEHENFTEANCLPILNAWKEQLYDKYGEAPYAFVWDDGWDTYGEWQFHSGFPQGFTNMDNIGREMGAGQGAWLGPVGGYGTSGGYRRNYWSSKGGMQLSNPEYYKVFVNAVTGLLREKGYDFRFFKFDGISSQFSSVGPDPGATGNENAEAIIMAEKVLRGIKEDVFLNTTVGTWASPFWFQHTDAIWRQEKDDGTIGNNSNSRENWITYRDRLVYQNYVQNSPLCPINTLMTHGFIFTKFGGPAGFSRDWKSVLNELRCAFACGSGMVELYNDYELTNNLVNPATGKAGELWGEIAKCMQWQHKNADVLPDIHWVGGNPWTGAKAEVYGWAAWNAKKAVLTLRNGANGEQQYKFTLREALDIPAYVNTTITLTKAFADQADLVGLPTGAIDIDEPLTVTLPGSSVYVFDGVDGERTVIESSISKYGFGTFYADKAMEIPVGVTAYVAIEEPVMNTAEAYIRLTEIEDGIIPANTGVIICGKQGTYTFVESYTNGTTNTTGNLLRGTATPISTEEALLNAPEVTNGVVYTLQPNENEDGVVFKQYADDKNPDLELKANKAYLVLPAGANAISIRFEGTTDIEHSTLNPQPSTQIYDLFGRRVEAITKGGIYIVNGKKVVIK